MGQRRSVFHMCIYMYVHIYMCVYIYIYIFFFFGEGSGTPLQYSCLGNLMDGGAWWAVVHGVSKSRTWLSDFTFHFHALGKEMATHSSVLALRIPGKGESGGLLFMGSHRVGHDWGDFAAVAASAKRHPTSLQGEWPEMGEVCGPNFPFSVTFSWSLWLLHNCLRN